MPAKLEPPILPTYLYRYRSLERIDQEIDSIRNRYIWCSSFESMNDPMEGFFVPKGNKSDAVSYAKKKSLIGLASFTETQENELMWAHYADNYAGICVGYKSARLRDCLGNNARLVRLTYASDIPEVGGSIHQAAIRILSHKKSSWSYEREWRLLGMQGKEQYTSRNCVTDIYLGTRISTEHRKKLLKELRYPNLQFHQMMVDGYEHSFSRLRVR